MRRWFPNRTRLKWWWSEVELSWQRFKVWRVRQILKRLENPIIMKLMVWHWGRKYRDQKKPKTATPADPTPEISPNDLSYPLLQLSPHLEDMFYLRDAFAGVQIFGASGSGKSSGSGYHFARSFLEAGYGGLVLCGKNDERPHWQAYAKAVGREDHLVIFDLKGKWRFNFLDYEYKRSPNKDKLKRNLVHLFGLMGELKDPATGHKQPEPFWKNEGDKLLGHAIEVLTAAKDRISLFDIHEIIMSAPRSDEQTQDETWQAESFLFQCLEEATTKAGNSRDLLLAKAYWLNEFPTMPDKTRSNVISSFTGAALEFMQGALGDLFCTDTNIVPELTHQGAIIILDLPPEEEGRIGVLAQTMFKYFWMAAARRRTVDKDTRPVFLWSDESKFFLSRHDHGFLSTARSAKVATVYLTQDVSGYYEALGHGTAGADTLLANFQTKIFHQNTDPKTNQYAAESCARSFQERTSTSFGMGAGEDKPGNFSQTMSEQLDYNIQPETFLTMRQGDVDCGYMVDSILIKGGRRWAATGKSFLRVVWPQDVGGSK